MTSANATIRQTSAAPGTLIATFALHPESPVAEAIGVGAPHGMQVLEFRPGWAKYSAPNREAISGLAADLDIQPNSVEMP